MMFDGDNLETPDCYLVASFNDWMPARMKTMRTLTLEKHALISEVPVPRQAFNMDNSSALFADMVAPGAHYFYFVKDQGSIFLSPKYEVVRFKNTNIFLNRVIVKPRQSLEKFFVKKLESENDGVFMKDRSIFKDFIESTPTRLKKAFDEDVGFGKIARTCKNDPVEMQKICDYLLPHYERITNIYHFYIGISSYPTIATNELTSFAQKCNLLDKYVNLSALDRIIITTNVNAHNLKSSAERDLHRYEFLEIIVRLANAKFKETGQVKSTIEALEKLLKEFIYPNARKVDGKSFRENHCYNEKTNEILKKNETLIRKVYDTFVHPKKQWVTLDECRQLVKRVGLQVAEMQVGPIYAESLMLIIDTMRDQ